MKIGPAIASAQVRKSAELLRSPPPLGAAWDVSLVLVNIGILACSYVSPLPCSLGAEFPAPSGQRSCFRLLPQPRSCGMLSWRHQRFPPAGLRQSRWLGFWPLVGTLRGCRPRHPPPCPTH